MRAKSSWLLLLVALGLLAVPASAGEETKKMIVTRSGAHPAAPGPAEYFTGTVRVQSIFPVAEPSRVSAASVTFEPGARSAWHVHPTGQTLVVTSGTGWTTSGRRGRSVPPRH
jgi:quercetin dioxygenase-like cupin family protein